MIQDEPDAGERETPERAALRFVEREEFCTRSEVAEFLRLARDLAPADADAAAEVLVGRWLASGWIEIAACEPEPLIRLTAAGVAAAGRSRRA